MKIKRFMMFLLVLCLCVALCACGESEEVKAAIGIYQGQYTKLVGDDTKLNEEFSLELKSGGKGVHHRDDMDFNVTWKLDGERFTMTETFLGAKLEYTGTLKDGKLDIFNGDPEDIWTYEYVYIKGAGEALTEEPDAEETEAPAEEAQTASWGDWTVDVPAGFALEGGDFLDENDPRYFSVKKSSFSYFDFKAEGEDRIMSNYNYNKDTYTNEQEDVSGSFGGNEWIGFQYGDGFGGYGFEAYTTIGGEMIRVSSAGFAFDEEMTKEVLSSLQYTPAEAAAPETEEHAEATEEEPTEGAPVYVKTIELKDVFLGIEEGYTEKKDATPAQYIMDNDETGGRISIWNSSGNIEDEIASIMGSMDYELREETYIGMDWSIATSDGYYCFGTQFGDNVLVITIDYGGTDEEMEALIFGVVPKN